MTLGELSAVGLYIVCICMDFGTFVLLMDFPVVRVGSVELDDFLFWTQSCHLLSLE